LLEPHLFPGQLTPTLDQFGSNGVEPEGTLTERGRLIGQVGLEPLDRSPQTVLGAIESSAGIVEQILLAIQGPFAFLKRRLASIEFGPAYGDVGTWRRCIDRSGGTALHGDTLGRSQRFLERLQLPTQSGCRR
jgi:hypothetical protein